MKIVQRQADMCAALADPHRVMLLYAIADAARSVGELVDQVGLSQPSVSHHLRVMRERGVVLSERRGKQVYYFPADPRIIEVLDRLRTILMDEMQQQGRAAQSAKRRPNL